MIMNGSSTIGRLAFAAVGDKLGALNMHIGTQMTCSLLVYILWTLAGSTSAAVAFCVLFGAFSGSVIGLPPASIANILKNTYTDPSNAHLVHAKLGQWTGMMYSTAAIPALIGPLVAGHLVSEYRTYITVQLWSGVSLTISAICMMVARWHLPTDDGTHVSTHLWRLIGKHEKAAEAEKRTPNRVTVVSEASSNFSLSTTRVNSQTVTRQSSQEKIDIEKENDLPEPAVLASRRNLRGEPANAFPVSV